MKRERQKLILELIETTPIERQEELAALLEQRGLAVTQASVSRDLGELGIEKVGGRYALARAGDVLPAASVAFGSAGPNLIVARCRPGLASAIAVQIDGASLAGVVGTIAGDDTIFLAVRDGVRHAAIIRQLSALFDSKGGGTQ
jgi:transcriptional regulator of arginine metabolism